MEKYAMEEMDEMEKTRRDLGHWETRRIILIRASFRKESYYAIVLSL
jgi:hypothetical protein